MVCYQSLSLDGLQVLVVDGDSDSRYLLKLIFEEYGVETIVATSAGEALEILKQVKPDLLISEIRLPNEDGYSLMHKVKAFESERQVQIPALALTVYTREDDRTHALSVGFDRHLPKPFDIDELIGTVSCLTLTQHVQTVLA
ncbi:MAG: response regulator [Coleofasciculus sp. C3-bin4]|nr:response regulator [Coleofasciculus sp. C3-bin4]